MFLRLAILVLVFVPATAIGENYDTLVVCPPLFQTTLEEWVQYREGQGHKILVIDSPSNADVLKNSIRELAKKYPIKNLVLVGDAKEQGAGLERLTPTAFVDAKVNVKYGSEPEIATDHIFADLDDDGIPELNLGRIPADSSDELRRYLDRVYEYESKEMNAAWRRRINFVAGVGGFGQLLDKMIEQSVKKIVTDLIPAEFEVTMTYGSWRSPYCPDPRKFSDTAIGRFNEGCLFWVYIGHGHRRQLDDLRLPDRRLPILDERNVGLLNSRSSFPIAILLSCYSAAIDAEKDGLGELMMDQPNGPIATISSSRVSMPYGMGVFSLEILDQYFEGDAASLGELVRTAKQRLVEFNPEKSEYHHLLHSMAQSFSPDADLLVEERKEHVHLMHLLGDPLLRIQRPDRLELDVPLEIQKGDTVVVKGTARNSGQLTVDLTYRRDRFRNRPPRRKKYLPTNSEFDSYQNVYLQTQNLNCVSKTLPVKAGPFQIKLKIPNDCSGDCHIRGLLQSDSDLAIGSKDVTIKSYP
ncbi:MAG: C25 family cysteine peptidase [Planctomycetota bacterium]